VSLCWDDAIKWKVVPVHAMKAYGGSGSIASLFLNFRTKWRRIVRLHAPAALPLGNNSGTL